LTDLCEFPPLTIIAEPVSETDLGVAIMDRLRRAAVGA
jgi:hypothetical protein